MASAAITHRREVDRATDFLDGVAIGVGSTSFLLAASGFAPAAVAGLSIAGAAATLGTGSETLGLMLAVADPNATVGERSIRAAAVGLGLTGGQAVRIAANKIALREMLAHELQRAGFGAGSAEEAAQRILEQLEREDPARRLHDRMEEDDRRDAQTGACSARHSNCD